MWWNALIPKVTANTPVSSPVVLGKNGVERRLDIGSLSAYEEKALNGMLDVLKADIALGEKFINS
jgi:malate dehydrogenase